MSIIYKIGIREICWIIYTEIHESSPSCLQKKKKKNLLTKQRQGNYGKIKWDLLTLWLSSEIIFQIKYFSISLPRGAQFRSVAQSCPTLCDPMNCSTPGLPVHHQLPESTQTMFVESVMPLNHLMLCHALLPLPLNFPSIRVLSNESPLPIKWPKYWSFSFSISPSNEYSGLISFRMDWLDLLAFQGTFYSLLQHHSSKASILQHSTFFIAHTWPLEKQ